MSARTWQSICRRWSREYVLVDQHEAHIEVITRTEAAWMLREARKGERIALASIGCELDVDSVYEGVLDAG